MIKRGKIREREREGKNGGRREFSSFTSFPFSYIYFFPWTFSLWLDNNSRGAYSSTSWGSPARGANVADKMLREEFKAAPTWMRSFSFPKSLAIKQKLTVSTGVNETRKGCGGMAATERGDSKIGFRAAIIGQDSRRNDYFTGGCSWNGYCRCSEFGLSEIIGG